MDNLAGQENSITITDWNDNKCDKWDYVVAVSCGALAGLIDIIFVNNPDSSILGKQTDKLADSFVERAGEFFYSQDTRDEKLGKKKRKKPSDLHGWISYLEQAFPVPYDARYTKDLQQKRLWKKRFIMVRICAYENKRRVFE